MLYHILDTVLYAIPTLSLQGWYRKTHLASFFFYIPTSWSLDMGETTVSRVAKSMQFECQRITLNEDSLFGHVTGVCCRYNDLKRTESDCIPVTWS